MFSENFVISTFYKISNNLPKFVIRSLKYSVIWSFILSILDLFSLSLLLPVIQTVFDPSKLNNNRAFSSIRIYFNNLDDLSFILLLLVFVLITFIVKNYISYLISRIQTKMFYDVASQLITIRYNEYLKQGYIKHLDVNSSFLLRNVTQIPIEFVITILNPLSALLNETVIIVLLAISVFAINYKLFLLLVAVLLPTLYLYNKIHKKRLNYISSEKDRVNIKLNKEVSQTFEGIREYIVYDKLNYFKNSISKLADQFTKLHARSYLISYISPKIVEVVAVLALLTVFVIGKLFDYSLSQLSSLIIIYAITLYRTVPSLNRVLMSLNSIRIGAYVFDHLDLDYNSDKEVNDDKREEIQFNKSIRFSNLYYSYPNTLDKHTLQDFNLEIKKGDRIGIIGASGSGKTTFLNVMLRLLKETKGEIYVDDVKLQSAMDKSWYKIVGYVPQNVIIFDTSLVQNIAFGIEADHVDYNKINEVIYKAQLQDFVTQLPNGLNTELGEHGGKISGGQRQRIGIARALYNNPKLLILDEATSALDLETERQLTEAIQNIEDKNLTIICVAHRYQTLKFCHTIYEMHKGTLKPEGLKYEEIMKNGK